MTNEEIIAEFDKEAGELYIDFDSEEDREKARIKLFSKALNKARAEAYPYCEKHNNKTEFCSACLKESEDKARAEGIEAGEKERQKVYAKGRDVGVLIGMKTGRQFALAEKKEQFRKLKEYYAKKNVGFDMLISMFNHDVDEIFKDCAEKNNEVIK